MAPGPCKTGIRAGPSLKWSPSAIVEGNKAFEFLELPDRNMIHPGADHLSVVSDGNVYRFDSHYEQGGPIDYDRMLFTGPMRNDRLRGEVRGMVGPGGILELKNGQTWRIHWALNIPPTLKGTGRFTHIFQLKFVDTGGGLSGSPILTLSLSSPDNIQMRLWLGGPSFPVINLGREMTIDAGGAGQWRGQPGTLNVKKILKPSTAMTWVVSKRHPLRGLCGGEDACAYWNRFMVGTENEIDVENTAFVKLAAGSVIAYQNGGGSGVGPAIKRDPQAVRDDVLDELVSIAAAREKFGVIFVGSLENYDLEVDIAATEALRKEMSRAAAAMAA